MKTFNDILQIANNEENNLWAEGIALLNWADKNASEEDKETFVIWTEGKWENVETIGDYEPTEFFENAPSWKELRYSNIERARQLWTMLGDIPVDDYEQIDEDFQDENENVIFEKGTDIFAIWHWFEETFNVSIAEDLMYK